MNNVILIGRLTRDPELRQTSQGISVAQFTIAVDRRYKEKEADFINCVAWRKTAENINKYFDKGRMIAVQGRLQSRSYDDKDGKRVYVTEVIVDEFSFVDSGKGKGNSSNYQPAPAKPVQQAQATTASPFDKADDLVIDESNLPF